MCNSIDMMCDSLKQKNSRVKYTDRSLTPYYHACCGKIPLCLYLWPTVCIDSVQVLGLPTFFFFSPLKCILDRKGCFISAHRYDRSISLHPDLSHTFLLIRFLVWFFFFTDEQNQVNVLALGLQLAKHRHRQGALPTPCVGIMGTSSDPFLSVGTLPGTMQASQWDTHWWAKYFSRQELTE